MPTLDAHSHGSSHWLAAAIMGLLATLAGCAKLNAPVNGQYRAVIEVSGGDIPFSLVIIVDQGEPQLTLFDGDQALKATHVRINNGELYAVLPNQLGALQATFDRHGLQGEWQLTPAPGGASTLPLVAKYGAYYRFVEKSLSDNADVTGEWQLHLAGDIQPVTLALKQTHDAVAGQLQWADGVRLMVSGQVHNNDVYLAAFGTGQVWLFKGKVDQHGELAGRAWRNRASEQTWTAQQTRTEPADTQSDDMRRVVLPWRIPTP